jgi:hypothetical protein
VFHGVDFILLVVGSASLASAVLIFALIAMDFNALFNPYVCKWKIEGREQRVPKSPAKFYFNTISIKDFCVQSPSLEIIVLAGCKTKISLSALAGQNQACCHIYSLASVFSLPYGILVSPTIKDAGQFLIPGFEARMPYNSPCRLSVIFSL